MSVNKRTIFYYYTNFYIKNTLNKVRILLENRRCNYRMANKRSLALTKEQYENLIGANEKRR